GDEFPIAENFKKVAQQGTKAAGFAFSISLSKMSGGEKDEEYNELLLVVQKVAYAEEMNEVEKAFKEVSQVTMKSRNPEYIQNYLKEWKKDADDNYDMILKEISWKSGPFTFDYWMKMLQIGDIIANAYKRPLYFFLLQISLTFLQYYYPFNQNKALAITFVNQNHYVAMVLKPGTPAPPIVNQWIQFPTLAAVR
ncbi:15699_t:CDS:2, partial [Dentiscutata heterogama]